MNPQFNGYKPLAVFMITFCILIPPQIVWGMNIPITVQEALPSSVNGLDRVDQPVTVGIPLKKDSGIKDAKQLGLSGVNKGQFRVLARWPNGNVKWVLADFQTSVPANGSNRAVSLIDGTGNFGGANLAKDSGAKIHIDTGIAQFVINKTNFNFLNGVTVNDITLVNSHTAGGIVMRDASDVIFASVNDENSTAVIEENGPMRAVVKSEGSLKNNSGDRLMDYTVRMHFYTGKSYVKCFITLRNASLSNTHPVTFKNAEVHFPISLSDTKSFEFADKVGSTSGTFTGTETAYLFQAFSRDKIGGDAPNWPNPPMHRTGGAYDYAQEGYEIKHAATVLHSLSDDTDYTRGWGEVRNASGEGLTVAFRWMSGMWPASIEFEGSGNVTIGLYSKFNSLTNLKFAWGAHDTREILLDFHTSSADNDAVLYNLQYPLVGRVPLDQYAKSGAFFGETRLVTADQQTAWFEARLQEMIDAGLSRSGQKNAQEAIGYIHENLSIELLRCYIWTQGGGNNQLDLAYSWLYDYMRTGLGGFYLQGEQHTLFKCDFAVCHSDGFDFSQNPVVLNNTKVIHFRTFDAAHSHWISMPIYYYMTGNQIVKEAIIDLGEFLSYEYPYKPAQIYDDMRIYGRTIRNYALLSEFAGQVGDSKETQYLNTTINFMNQVLDSRDDSPNTRPLGRNLDRGYIWQFHTYDEPRHLGDFFLVQIHYEGIWEALRVLRANDYSRVEDVEDYLLGLAYFIYEEMYFETDTRVEVCDYGYFYDYDLDNPNVVDDNSWFRPISSGRAMMHAYEKTGDIKYLDRERKLLFGCIQYVNDLAASERKSQAFIWTDLRRDEDGYQLIEDLITQDNGGGSYTLTWEVPDQALRYQIKYADEPIVEWLGFDQSDRGYYYDPASYTPFFAANNVQTEPEPLHNKEQQTYTIRGLDPAKSWHFAVKYTVKGGPQDNKPPDVPSGLRIGKNKDLN